MNSGYLSWLVLFLRIQIVGGYIGPGLQLKHIDRHQIWIKMLKLILRVIRGEYLGLNYEHACIYLVAYRGMRSRLRMLLSHSSYYLTLRAIPVPAVMFRPHEAPRSL